MSKPDPPEQLLERPAEVDRHRRRPRPRAARHRQARADREDRRAAVPAGARPVQEPSNSAAGRSARARIARRDSRTAAREPDGAATTT